MPFSLEECRMVYTDPMLFMQDDIKYTINCLKANLEILYYFFLNYDVW